MGTPAHIDRDRLSHSKGKTPCTGVWYIAPSPRGWQLYAWRYDEYPEACDHSFFWASEVCARLTNAWGMVLNPTGSPQAHRKLREALLPYYSAFPRGRISQSERGLRCFWGDNFPETASGLKADITEYFSLKRTKWEFDDHEVCLTHDYDAVRKILPLRDVWRQSS